MAVCGLRGFEVGRGCVSSSDFLRFRNVITRQRRPVAPPGVSVIKLFSFIVDDDAKKLECLYLAVTFQPSLTFAGNT